MPPKSRSRRPLKNAKIVESFRGESKSSVPLHELELALVLIACIHLCFLPWALGARAPWAQITSAVLGTLALIVACWPRRYEGELAPQGAFILHPWSRLLKFPVFWLGLALLGYVACQALNPAYRRVEAFPYWCLVPIENITWLPSGVDAPFEKMNAWRMLCIWGGAWTLACALWIGLTRRSGLLALTTCVCINGGAVALFAILQKVTGANAIYWLIPSPTPLFHGPFIYENHAGAYLNLVLTLTAALAFWHYSRGLSHLKKSTPAPLYLFVAIVVASSVFMSKSRATIVLLVAFAGITAALFTIWRIRQRTTLTSFWLTAVSSTCIAGIIVASAVYLNLRSGVDEVRTLWEKSGQSSLMVRDQARMATLDMFEAEKATGWGAGSFRHIFPAYQKNYPKIYKTGNQMFNWDHAHNDYVQLLAEVGMIGAGLVLAGLLWALIRGARHGVFQQPHLSFGILGLCLCMVHAWIDFPLSNTTVITTFAFLLIALLKWGEFEHEINKAAKRLNSV